MKNIEQDIRLLYIDLFCGAGGTSTGCENALLDGRKVAKVIACVNHDAHAIASHAANHPEALHFTEDIRTLELEPMVVHVNAQRAAHPNAKVVLWASLECTNFSRAKGGMSRDADSRTLAEHLFRYVEAIQPDIIQIENVDEFQTWGPLTEKRRRDGSVVTVKKSSGKGASRKTWTETALIPDPEHKGEYYHRWVRTMCSYGYHFDSRILNSADYGAYTSRKRYFAMFARDGIDIVFPEPTHARDPQRTIFGEQLERWKPVREVLDLQDRGVSIFDRRKPLVDATLRRIYAGLVKFVADGDDSFLTKAYGGNPEEKCSSVERPSGAITTKDHHQFITAYYGHGGAHSIERPAPTVTTKDRLAMIYIDNQYGHGTPTSIDEPCGTVTNVPKQNPVCVHFAKQANAAPWLMQTNYDNIGQSLDVPSKVVTADRHWAYLVNPQFSCPGNSIDAPAPTVIARQDKKPLTLAMVTTEGRHPSFIHTTDQGLLYEVFADDSAVMRNIKAFMAAYGIIDITMRMLRIRELKLIQGFPADYVLVGSQQEQKKYLGNAVVTVVAKAWCEAIARSFTPQEIRKTA